MKEHYVTPGARLMGARTGRLSAPEFNTKNLGGVKMMYQRLDQAGGRTQQERMIRDKRRSLDKAVLYSYQGAFVKKCYPAEDEVDEKLRGQPPVRALINPDKVKQDYDDKIISIGYEHDFKPGDVFEWVNTDSYWLIYLQDKTELAYFRGEIRRCRYTINFKDDNGNIHTIYAAVRGPVETKINYIQKNGVSIDRPNLSINLLIPYTKLTLDYFNRYKKLFLVEDENETCWRIEATDWISTPGIIQVNAVEYYIGGYDDVENSVADGLKVEAVNPNTERIEKFIEGDSFIKPKGIYTYTYTGLVDGEWSIDKKYPVEYKIIDNNTIKLRWTASYSGQFELVRGKMTKTIVVESLF